MKTSVAVLSLTLYVIALIRPAYPLVEYYMKLEEYQAKCINRSMPQLHCNGQCILMQKLKAFQHQEPDPVAPVPVKVHLEDYPLSLIDETHLLTSLTSTNHTITRYQSIHFDDRAVAEIFKPPRG